MVKSITSRNNVSITGNGTQPMLFAHGFGCDQHMWRFIIPAFEADYKVIAFDYVGHGQSDVSQYNSEKYASLRGYAQDILDIIEELDLSDIIFVGHSVSSMIGMMAAIERPDRFARIIMVAPSPCYINDGDYHGGFERDDIEGLLETMEQNYIGWANYLGPAIMGNAGRPQLSEELVGSFCSTNPVIAKDFAEATFLSDSRDDLKHLTIPALVLQCADDIIAPQTVGNYLLQELPFAVLIQMQATGHCPHMSEPEETVKLIRQYLLTSA